jgi:hypothetical protein
MFWIVTDFLGALQSLDCSVQATCPMVEKIKYQMYHILITFPGVCIRMAHSPSHFGIAGNEYVDSSAKEAARGETSVKLLQKY